MRVLIAEDDDSTREMFLAYFESERDEVVCVDNGAAALSNMRLSPPDVVLLDLAMPILSGWDVLLECSGDAALSTIPLVVLTAFSDVDERVRELGAVACLTKPIDLKALRQVISAHAHVSADRESPQHACKDVLDRRLQERVFKALLHSEQQYRSLMTHASDAILMLDAEFRCVMANRRAAHLLGYSCEELSRLGYADLLPFHVRESDPPRVNTAAAGSLIREREFLRKDGTTVTGEVSVAVLPDGHIQVLVRDLTERHRLQNHLIEAQKMEAVGRLAGGIAHDFNNMLTAVLGYSDLLLERIDPDGDTWADLREIHRAAERAAALTRQLLAFSRAERLDVATVDMNKVVRRLEPLIQKLMGEHTEVTLNLGVHLPPVKADVSQLEQALVNLATNARDAMHPHGGRLVIETSLRSGESSSQSAAGDHTPERVRLTVTDSGCGMDEATKARILEPFFTTKDAGRGTGLGLSTVHGSITKLGGSLEVCSDVGEGTSIHLYFPSSDQPIQPEITSSRTAAPLGSETILVVDDDPSVLKFVADVLMRHGYVALQASAPQEALAVAEHHRGSIALILADVVMPQMDGRELVAQLKAVRPDVVFLLMSGYTGTASVNIGGDEGWLKKPFTSRQLLVGVREALDNRPAAIQAIH